MYIVKYIFKLYFYKLIAFFKYCLKISTRRVVVKNLSHVNKAGLLLTAQSVRCGSQLATDYVLGKKSATLSNPQRILVPMLFL